MAGSSVGEGGIYNQVNFNLYHYGNNNPIKYTDPDGKSVLGKVLGYGCYIAVVVAPAAVTLAGKLTVVGTAILATDVVTEKIGENLAKSKGNKEPEAKPADKPSLMPETGAESSKPENKSPEGAGRKGTLNEAKRKNGYLHLSNQKNKRQIMISVEINNLADSINIGIVKVIL